MVAIQRPLKGSRISSFYPVKSLPPLASLDSAFQLQEYISLLIRTDVHDVEAIVSLPGKQNGVEREGSDGMEDKDGEKDNKAEVSVGESCWVYEQLRRLAQDLTHPLITTLQHECTRSTCPEMKAGEWLYLCVAHGNDGTMEKCCAIDYILHTLDSATALLNSPRAFPSRLSIPPTSTRHFSSLARRLGRVFAHAYDHHREAFEQAEAESSLYARYLALTSKFNLVPAEFLLIPPRIASVDFEHDREDPRDRDPHSTDFQLQDPKQWTFMSDSSSVVNLSMGYPSSPNPDIAGSASPRKLGRHRTDTMVASEAANVVEELARSSNLSAEELDREIAAERMLSAVPQRFDEPVRESEPYSSLQESAVTGEEHITSEADEILAESAPTQETELLLDIAAPAPTEPAIPVDVEIEEDITEESSAPPAVIDSEETEPTPEDHQELITEPSVVPEEPSEDDAQREEAPTAETVEAVAEKSVEPPVEPSAVAEAGEDEVKPLEVEEPQAVESRVAQPPPPIITPDEEKTGTGEEESTHAPAEE